MKKVLLAGLFVAVAQITSAQIVYNPGGGGGGSFSSPGTGIITDTGGGSLAARTLTCGTGTACVNGDGASGNPTISVDVSVTPQKGSGSGSPPSDCGNSGNTYQTGDMYRDTATNTLWICEGPRSTTPNTGSWWPITRGRGAMAFIEDFCGAGTATLAIGSEGWLLTSIAGGSSITSGTSMADAPCVLDWSEGTSGDGSVFNLRAWNLTTITSRDWYLEWSYIPGSSGGITLANTAVYFGLIASGTSPTTASGGLWIRRDTTIGDTAYVFAICDSATTGCQSLGDDTNQKVVASTITPTTAVKSNLRMWHLNSGVGGASTYYFSVDGETPKTFCASGCDDDLTQVPASGTLGPAMVFIDQTTAARNMDIDFARGYVAVTR